MSRYEYANLYTIYACNINNRYKKERLTHDVCFGKSLTYCFRLHNVAQYTIVLIRNDSAVKEHHNNYCWMNKHKLENYLRRIQSIKYFSYKVSEGHWSNKPCYKIKLNIEGTKKEITFVLQCIKRCYEFPYNFYLHQAYELQKLPAFKFDSILNLFNVVFSTFRHIPNTGHSFSGASKFETYKTLREKLPNVTYVTDLYPQSSYDTSLISKLAGVYTCNGVPADTEQWTLDLFNYCLPTYIENYNVLKK